MATFANGESGSSVRTKVNAAITTVDALGSASNGDGASLVAIEDSGGLFTATDVEAALAENRTAIDAIEADYQVQPSEGAFVDGDKTKLDGIEALADVTDTTNVTAAGALMDSEVTNLADVKAFDTTDYATAAQGATADTAVQPGDAVTTLDGTAWRVVYTDASGDVTELALGADGTFLKSNGASSAPSFATPAGSGDVSKVGTPADNQIGVWTGDGTIEGVAALTYSANVFGLDGGILLTERADHAATPAAGKAELWVSNDATQKLQFTDDAGTDKEVAFITGGTDLSAYTGVLGLNSGTAVDVNTKALLEARLSDVSNIAEADGDVYTGTHDFGGADDLEIPNSATPTVDTDGQIAIDTTVTDFSHGVLKYFGGEEMAAIAVPIAELTSPTGGHVVAYNATNDEFELVSQAGGGDMAAATYDAASIEEQLVGLTATQTLTNKDISNANNTYRSASATVTGAVELATAAETTTGTDTGRAVTPDGLAGSVYGQEVVTICLFDDSEDVATGDGAGDQLFRIPSKLNGWNLTGVAAYVQTAGTTNTTDIQIHNVTAAADVLSTKLTIDSTETDTSTAATPAVIDTGEDDVATGDKYRFDVDAVSTTAPKGLWVELTFALA